MTKVISHTQEILAHPLSNIVSSSVSVSSTQFFSWWIQTGLMGEAYLYFLRTLKQLLPVHSLQRSSIHFSKSLWTVTLLLAGAVTQFSCLSYEGSLKMSAKRTTAATHWHFELAVFCLNSAPFCKLPQWVIRVSVEVHA